jgi:hypothetical protein
VVVARDFPIHTTRRPARYDSEAATIIRGHALIRAYFDRLVRLKRIVEVAIISDECNLQMFRSSQFEGVSKVKGSNVIEEAAAAIGASAEEF